MSKRRLYTSLLFDISTNQLLHYPESIEAGKTGIQFCQCSLRVRFMRSPMVIATEDIDKLWAALDENLQLKKLLKGLVS